MSYLWSQHGRQPSCYKMLVSYFGKGLVHASSAGSGCMVRAVLRPIPIWSPLLQTVSRSGMTSPTWEVCMVNTWNLASNRWTASPLGNGGQSVWLSSFGKCCSTCGHIVITNCMLWKLHWRMFTAGHPSNRLFEWSILYPLIFISTFRVMLTILWLLNYSSHKKRHTWKFWTKFGFSVFGFRGLFLNVCTLLVRVLHVLTPFSGFGFTCAGQHSGVFYIGLRQQQEAINW